MGCLCRVRERPSEIRPEFARSDGIVEAEHRGALHELLYNRGPDPAARVEHAHPSVVARDQRSLCGRKRD
jgi:hypothetical protein